MGSRMVTVAVLIGVGLGLLFAVSGLLKLADRPGFQSGLARYKILPARLVPTASRVVPAVEVAIGVCLLVGLYSRLAAAAATIFLVVVTVGVVVNLRRGRSIPCACFGTASTSPITIRTVVRNAALFVLALIVVTIPATPTGSTGDRGAYVVSIVCVALGFWLAHALRRYRGAGQRLQLVLSGRNDL